MPEAQDVEASESTTQPWDTARFAAGVTAPVDRRLPKHRNRNRPGGAAHLFACMLRIKRHLLRAYLPLQLELGVPTRRGSDIVACALTSARMRGIRLSPGPKRKHHRLPRGRTRGKRAIPRTRKPLPSRRRGIRALAANFAAGVAAPSPAGGQTTAKCAHLLLVSQAHAPGQLDQGGLTRRGRDIVVRVSLTGRDAGVFATDPVSLRTTRPLRAIGHPSPFRLQFFGEPAAQSVPAMPFLPRRGGAPT